MKLALVGRMGYLGVWCWESQARAIYQRGVKLALAGDLLQVWQMMDNGDLLKYDSKRTRTLTDKVAAARRAAA